MNLDDLTSTNIKSGFVAIIGRPNVGKSTLLNQIIGSKISIVSKKAQTTRHRILGIETKEDVQFVFVDTPGFQTKHSNALNKAMNRGVKQAINDVDVIILVIEAARFGAPDKLLIPLLPKDIPVILAVNKIDEIKDKNDLLPLIQRLSTEHDFAAIIPISAEKNMQIGYLLDELKKHLPQEGLLYEEDQMTDRSERFLAAEYIREKLFRLLGDEIPYTTTVEIEKFTDEERLTHINAAIIIDRETHKSIVIGKGGQTLKRIATEARADMENLFGRKVFLEIFVKVKSGWSDDERLLKSLGYE